MKPGTLDSYADNLRRHVIPIIGPERLTRLRPVAVRTLLAELQRKPSGRPSKGGEPATRSNRTVAYCHAILRAALADAVADELVQRNVAAPVEPPAVVRSRPQPLTRDEAGRLLEAARGDRLYPLWLTLLAVGLRRGECLAVRWNDVNLDRGTLTVRRSLQRLRGEG
ncbi:MAG: tyrosine-type recombinase/integrase [Frankiaceae bacterium]